MVCLFHCEMGRCFLSQPLRCCSYCYEASSRGTGFSEDGSFSVMKDCVRIALTCVTGLIESLGRIDGLFEYWAVRLIIKCIDYKLTLSPFADLMFSNCKLIPRLILWPGSSILTAPAAFFPIQMLHLKLV